MDQAIAEEDVPRVKILSVSARLFFRRKRIDALAFRFHDRDGAAVGVQQHVIDETFRRAFKIFTEIGIRRKSAPTQSVL